MKENIFTVPLFNPDSEDEDDVEMNDDKSGTITPVPQGNATAGEVVLFRHISHNPLLKFGPFPQRASNIQEGRDDTEMDNNDGASHPESITPAPPQSTGVGAGTVALFHRNPGSPLFKHGTKRPVEEDEEDQNRKDEERKRQVRINVSAIRLCNNLVC